MDTQTQLKGIREARAYTAAGLAKIVGVSRQTIYAIEDGAFVPNTAVALRLAKALDVSVEELFSLSEATCDAKQIRAEVLSPETEKDGAGSPVRLCRVAGRVMAVPVTPAPAYLPLADGVVANGKAGSTTVLAAADRLDFESRLLIAGCDPALSLLSELLHPAGVEVISLAAGSRRSLGWLKKGRVHAAGSHLRDPKTGEFNLPFIRRLFGSAAITVFTFAEWEQGLVVRRGNPKELRGLADLGSKGVKIVNREIGSGSRNLLDEGLRAAGISPQKVAGYQVLAEGHLSAAYAVASGLADCCVANRAAARSFHLPFIPLALERFDLAFSESALDLPATGTLLDALNRRALRRRLALFAGYETAATGKCLNSRR